VNNDVNKINEGSGKTKLLRDAEFKESRHGDWNFKDIMKGAFLFHSIILLLP
jgi:hypothetical protein